VRPSPLHTYFRARMRSSSKENFGSTCANRSKLMLMRLHLGTNRRDGAINRSVSVTLAAVGFHRSLSEPSDEMSRLIHDLPGFGSEFRLDCALARQLQSREALTASSRCQLESDMLQFRLSVGNT